MTVDVYNGFTIFFSSEFQFGANGAMEGDQ